MTNTPTPRPDVEGIAAHSKDVVINGQISLIRLELLIDEDIPALIAHIEALEARMEKLEAVVEPARETVKVERLILAEKCNGEDGPGNRLVSALAALGDGDG